MSKQAAALETFIVGDWSCEAFNVDETSTELCTFLAGGHYNNSEQKSCGAPDASWGTWRVEGDAVYIGGGTLPRELLYRATMSESQLMLDGGAEHWVHLRALDCASVCAASDDTTAESTP